MTRTVAMMSEKDLNAYRKALRSRRIVVKDEVRARLKKARQLARRAATVLKKEFGVEKVALFGSLIHPKLFHAHSDVDLVTWGLIGKEYYRAVGVLQSLDPEFTIDLIAFEDASPTLMETILREGKVI
jgi:predicted nucleotidyltransferase